MLISGEHLGGLVSYETGCAYLPVAVFICKLRHWVYSWKNEVSIMKQFQYLIF